MTLHQLRLDRTLRINPYLLFLLLHVAVLLSSTIVNHCPQPAMQNELVKKNDINQSTIQYNKFNAFSIVSINVYQK